ncbi:hypothetical protein [Nostoc sp.]|uniref:hypothetical protein n=1 Tax=Nostoc sp. TaxID=1180 RepID=UPI002FFA55A0
MRYELRSNTTPVATTEGTSLRVTLVRVASPEGRRLANATLTPVAYGGKPAYSAGFTATHWLLYNT